MWSALFSPDWVSNLIHTRDSPNFSFILNDVILESPGCSNSALKNDSYPLLSLSFIDVRRLSSYSKLWKKFPSQVSSAEPSLADCPLRILRFIAVWLMKYQIREERVCIECHSDHRELQHRVQAEKEEGIGGKMASQRNKWWWLTESGCHHKSQSTHGSWESLNRSIFGSNFGSLQKQEVEI